MYLLARLNSRIYAVKKKITGEDPKCVQCQVHSQPQFPTIIIMYS